ncbi:MAG: hypothetical protein H6842_07035 [Rhodospirillaceae bacterium]|jgi:hypothetical protein|nr:hypothetical protein [Rhodospirillaceae bacterium]
MFGITTAYRFYEKASSDFGDVQTDIADPRSAMNCILSLYPLHEWVWARWLKKRPDVQMKLQLRNKDSFDKWLDSNCPHFTLLQDLANGTKHCKPVHPTQKIEGFGHGPFGVGPFGMPYLLIDQGAQCSPRYLVASDVLADQMAFWQIFFSTHQIVDSE